MNYTGFGPKGYERPDDLIRDDVCQALTDDIWVDASDIKVEVKYGYVYLRGEVVNRDQKKAAEAATEKVPGVKDVINYITLKKDLGLIGDMPIKANML
ncbi:MAG: BON domain-containing protein [Bacteriovoracia bacterium]